MSFLTDDKLSVPDFSECTITVECSSTALNGDAIDKIGYKINEDINIIVGLAATELSQLIDRTLFSMAKGDQFELNVKTFQLGIDILVIKLKDFEPATPFHQLQVFDSINRSLALREKGNKAFNKKEIKAAFHLFSRALKYLLCLSNQMDHSTYIFSSVITSDDISRMDSLKGICHLNLAACQLLGTNLIGALRNCEEAIKIKPDCVKAYYRSGQVRLKLKEYQLAINNFQKVLEMESGNKQAKKLLAEAKLHLHEDDKQLGDKLKGMFN